MSGLDVAPEDVPSEEPVERRGGKTKEHVRKIKEKIETLSEDPKIQENLEAIKGKLESLVKDCENTARERPFEAIGACFLVGLLVGIIVGVTVGKKK